MKRLCSVSEPIKELSVSVIKKDEIFSFSIILSASIAICFPFNEMGEIFITSEIGVLRLTSVKKEACPLGLAPTASSSLMLALGDALAVCVLNERDFSSEDFARSHPGGSLGKIVHIKDIMINLESTPKIKVEATIRDAIEEITNKKLGFTAIIDKQNVPKGIFTDGDLRRSLLRHISLDTPISEVMKNSPITLNGKQMAIEALKIMEKQKITSFLITDTDNSLIGSLTLQSLFKAKIL